MQNFFIVGAQKAGTTALHSYLSRHSQISMSTPKEIHFFDDETIDWSKPPTDELERQLGGTARQVRGEATPIYMYWPNAIERLKAYDAGARIIVLLRHPIYRALSHWKMETRRKDETLSFSDAIRAGGRQRVANSPGGAHRVFSYVERGFYAAQVARLLRHFPRAQIHFAKTDDLWWSPQLILSQVERFLGVEHELALESEYIVAASTDIPAPLENTDRLYLHRLFADDIVRTADLTGLDLSDWLAVDYREAGKAAA